MVHHIRGLQLTPPEEGDIYGDHIPQSNLTEEELLCLAETMLQHEPPTADCNSIIQHGDRAEGPDVEALRAAIFENYKTSAFSNATSGNPPKRF